MIDSDMELSLERDRHTMSVTYYLSENHCVRRG